MAQSFTDSNGITYVNPGTYVTLTVQPSAAQIATAGVVTIIGEADQGPDWTAEPDLSQNMFTPSQYGAILAKYRSGRVVDASKQLIQAANDPAIVGAVSLIRIIKTNPSIAAYALVARPGFGNFAKITSDIPGMPGNLINYASAIAQAEQAPSTGAFAYIPPSPGSVSFNLRVNGGVQSAITVTANMPPNVLQVLIENYSLGILCLGGQEKVVIPSAALNLTATAPSADVLVVSLPPVSVWSNSPAVGDTVIIPATGTFGAAQNSCIAGAGNANIGAYICTAVVNTLVAAQMTLARISSGSCVAASGSTNMDLTDVLNYSDMTIQNMTGQDRQASVGLQGTFNVISNDGANVVLQTPSATVWNTQPQVGDTAVFATAKGGIAAGFYQVISATSNSVNLTRISVGSSGSGSGNFVIGSPITPSTQPFIIERPVIDGLGKSLAIEGDVSSIFYVPSDQEPEPFSNSLLVSAAEYENSFSINQGTVTDTYTSGGAIALQIGCTQQLASVQITATALNFSVNGIAVFSAAMAQYPTLGQLAAFINSQTTFSAAVPVGSLVNQPPSILDEGTFGITGQAGVYAGRIKEDAIDWMQTVNQSALASFALQQFSGLPDIINPAQFLANGAKAGTTSAAYAAAVDASQNLQTNFLVSLFAQDASLDIAQGLTDPSSTYTISAINAYLDANALMMSTVLMRQNRIALGAILGTYLQAVQQAGQLSSYRMALCMQSPLVQNSSGQTVTFQPWMAAVTAAGMQAAAGYKGIVKKFARISGFVNPPGFNSQNPGSTQQALQAGLLFLESVATGGFRWNSDQLTYNVDNNFVYNSLQAVYVADLITLSLIDTFDRMVVGKSIADISAAAALSILDSEMFNFKRLKWIAASDDAPKGYTNSSAVFSQGAMQIMAEIKLAGLIYFVPIGLLVTQVQQTATAATGA